MRKTSSDPIDRKCDADAPSSRRRRFLKGLAAAGALGAAPRLAFAGTGAPGGNRFVLVVLRGGMDGLGAAPAIGDPDFASARGPLAQFGAPALALDATFALHPNLVELHAMVARGEAAVVHAVGLAVPRAIALRRAASARERRDAAVRAADRLARTRARCERAEGNRAQHDRSARAARSCRGRHLGAFAAARIRRPISSPGSNACTQAIDELATALQRARTLHLDARRRRPAPIRPRCAR